MTQEKKTQDKKNMLKDLRSVLTLKDKKVSADAKGIIDVKHRAMQADEVSIACDILEKLYWHVGESLRRDRSSIKLNLFEKGLVGSGLNRVMPGTKEYIQGMSLEDIKLLLDDILGRFSDEMIEKELNKRKIKK